MKTIEVIILQLCFVSLSYAQSNSPKSTNPKWNEGSKILKQLPPIKLTEEMQIKDGNRSFGYNIKSGKVFLSVDKITERQEVREKTEKGDEYILRKRYGFGLAPRIAYNIYKNFNGYVNFGTTLSKYKATGDNFKKALTKKSTFVGLGIEQTFGMMFVRGEFNKVFKKSVSKINYGNLKNHSYTFKIAGGYRF